MATILKNSQRVFEENKGKIDHFRLQSDVSRIKNGVTPENLHFDFRKLMPGEFSAPYHYHHFAEELFYIISGNLTLRTPKGREVVSDGDLIFFEKGETGAHQFYNHTNEPCIYLDIRTYIGYDVCEYPDSDKILLFPSYDIFNKKAQKKYFDGEENITDVWDKLPER